MAVIKVPTNLKIENISVTTANGTMLMSQKPKTNDISLDVNSLTTGTYLLNVKTAEGNVVKKVVKEWWKIGLD